MQDHHSMTVMKRILGRLFFVVCLTLSGASGAEAFCDKIGESCVHEGFWNVYAAAPGGDAWAEDYVGTQQSTLKLQSMAEAVVQGLSECGIKAEITNSSLVRGFRPDLVIVMSGPYASKDAAAMDVTAARSCGGEGYTKFGVWSEPGAE
jgi:hypothetical protein